MLLEAGGDEMVIEPKGSDKLIFRESSRTSSSTKIPFWKPYQIMRKAPGDGIIQRHPFSQTRIVLQCYDDRQRYQLSEINSKHGDSYTT